MSEGNYPMGKKKFNGLTSITVWMVNSRQVKKRPYIEKIEGPVAHMGILREKIQTRKRLTQRALDKTPTGSPLS